MRCVIQKEREQILGNYVFNTGNFQRVFKN